MGAIRTGQTPKCSGVRARPSTSASDWNENWRARERASNKESPKNDDTNRVGRARNGSHWPRGASTVATNGNGNATVRQKVAEREEEKRL